MRRNYTKKRNTLKLFVTATAAAAIIAAIFFSLGSRESSSDIVVAKINSQKIYKSEIERKIAAVFGDDQDSKLPQVEDMPKEVLEAFAKEIYLEKELIKRAKKEKISDLPKIANAIKEAESKIVIGAYFDSIVKDKVTDEKISEKYAELSNQLTGKKEFSLSHIVLKDREQAEKLYKILTEKKSKKRANFSDLAKKYSIDKDTASQGGELGYSLEDNIIKEISSILPHLKKGEISQPIQTKFGWHIIKLNDLREAKALPFESVKDNIKEQLIKDETGAIYNAIFKDSKIKILIKKDSAKNKNESEKIEKTYKDSDFKQVPNQDNQEESSKTEEQSTENADQKNAKKAQ